MLANTPKLLDITKGIKVTLRPRRHTESSESSDNTSRLLVNPESSDLPDFLLKHSGE